MTITKEKIKWYEHEKNKLGYHQCLAPYDNIFVSSYPSDGATKEWADQFDAIINVSCNPDVLFEPSRPDQRTYWYPLNEMGEWSYAYFAYIFKILNFHHGKGHKILVHCAAGAYRSPSAIFRWLEYKGHKLLDAYEISRGRRHTEKGKKEDLTSGLMHFKLFYNYIMGNMPPNYQEYMERLKENDKTGYTFVSSLEKFDGGPISDSRQIRAYRLQNADFFHDLKRRIKSKISDFKDKHKLYIGKRKRIRVGRGMYTVVPNHEKIGADRKYNMKEFM